MQTRLPLIAALALLSASAIADCKEVNGGRLLGLKSPVIWHARVACGGSTMLWFQSFAGTEGTKPVWRVDDLLIIPDSEQAQSLSLFSPLDLTCRHAADEESLVIADGEWSSRARQGGRQPVQRAWRVNPATRKVEELPARDVSCVIR